jgi:ribonuclease HI
MMPGGDAFATGMRGMVVAPCHHAAVTTVAYTDGACSGNPGPGGWAWAVPGGRWAAGPAAATTNQRMEICAAFEAVKALPGTLTIVSDSTYVVNCFKDRWHEGWKAKGWLNSQRKPVANRDLWEPFIELVLARGDVTFQWVKGHAGDPMNDLVDRLAVEAATTQQARSGSEPPDEVGPADRPGARRAAGAPGVEPRSEIAGHPLLVMGHRPTELGGYGDNPLADAVRARLGRIIEAKATLDDDLVVITGLRLGAETLAAEAAEASGVPFVAVLPYPDPASVWPAAAQARFAHLVGTAREVVTLQRKAPKDKADAGRALARRDAWLARNAAEAILVWDGKDAVLGQLFRALEDHLGDDVWVLDPAELAQGRGFAT